jgi:hypothetical protein
MLDKAVDVLQSDTLLTEDLKPRGVSGEARLFNCLSNIPASKPRKPEYLHSCEAIIATRRARITYTVEQYAAQYMPAYIHR